MRTPRTPKMRTTSAATMRDQVTRRDGHRITVVTRTDDPNLGGRSSTLVWDEDEPGELLFGGVWPDATRARQAHHAVQLLVLTGMPLDLGFLDGYDLEGDR